LCDLIAQYGLSHKIRLVGHCHDMPAAFLASYVALLPSLVAETFGRTSVEAQAMGCPVIVSNLGALPETIVSPEQDAVNFTGWLVPANHVGALADRLRLVLSLTPAERAKIGARASARASAEFALAQMQAKTLAVYDELLGTRLAELYANPPSLEAATMGNGA
jgi:glycosyltransferase involved in cell wall biosynthesis